MEITVKAPTGTDALLEAEKFINYHKPGAPVLNLTEGDFKLTASQFVTRLKERRPQVITYPQGKGRTAALRWAVIAAGWPCDLIALAVAPSRSLNIHAWFVEPEIDPAAFAPEPAQ